jgi:hypothetical protein
MPMHGEECMRKNELKEYLNEFNEYCLFLILLGLIIIIHELGHFIAAKIFRCMVL